MPQFLTSQTYGGSANLVSPALSGTPTAPTAAGSTNTTQVATTAFIQQAIQLGKGICTGRLTLTTGTPVTTSDVTGTTLYFTPWRGNQIGLYDGSSTWNLLAFAETSLAIPATTGLYDVFAYNNAGTLALEFGSAWTSAGEGTAAAGVRNQNLTLQDGIYVKAGATTRRYLGTISSASGTSYDTQQQRLVWNQRNQVAKRIHVHETTATWTSNVGSGVWRPANANANGLSWVRLTVGLKEKAVDVKTALTVSVNQVSPQTQGSPGIGYDSSTTALHDLSAQIGPFNGYNGGVAAMSHAPDIGQHLYWWLENTYSTGAAVTVYAGSPGTPYAAGLTGLLWC